MDIFNRKKLAAAEAEIIRLKEKNNKPYSEQEDISERIQTAEKNAKKYKQKLDKEEKIIEELKKENDKLIASVTELSNQVKRNENNCADYDNLIFQQKQQINAFNNKIDDLKKKLAEAETLNANLGLTLEQVQDYKNDEDTDKCARAAYIIRDEVIYGRKTDKTDWKSDSKINYKVMSTLLVSALYKNKEDKKKHKNFFTINEFNFFELIMPLIQSNNLVLLSKVRLADIIELWEEFYNDEAKEIAKKQNPFDTGKVFLTALAKNGLKSLINERMIELKPDFNNNDYLTAFLYPLFRLHIDFLICKHTNNNVEPLLVIELNGKEHYENSQNYDWKKIKNDELKEAIFRSKSVKIGFLTIYNDLIYEKRDELMKIMSDTLSAVSYAYDSVNWKEIQYSLSKLAEPYIEKIHK